MIEMRRVYCETGTRAPIVLGGYAERHGMPIGLNSLADDDTGDEMGRPTRHDCFIRGVARPFWGVASAVAFSLLMVMPSWLNGQPVAECEEVLPADTILWSTASVVVSVESELAQIWPGFWPPGRSFILTNPGQLVLLVSRDVPDEPFRPACVPDRFPDLRGQAYMYRGVLHDLLASEGYFDLAYRTGDVVATAVAYRDGVNATLEFLVHEAFHAYQDINFPPQQRNESADLEVYTRVDYNALAEIERRMLADALALNEPDLLQAHLRAYLAVRDRRLELTSEMFRRTEAELETIEGSAQYVGMVARRLATAAESPSLVEEAIASLQTPMQVDRWRRSAEQQLRWMHRHRLYRTGVALALVLERIGADWRTELEAGNSLVALLRSRVGYRPGCCEDDISLSLELYGYDIVRAQVEETLRSVGRASNPQ
jgi:hypothetical protein